MRENGRVYYKNKLTGEIFASEKGVQSKVIDGVEFVTIIHPVSGRQNLMRKDNLEVVR